MLKKLMKWIQDGNGPSKLPGSASAEANPVATVEPSEKPAKKDNGRDHITAAADAELKLASPRCDLHPLYLLRETVIDAAVEEPPARKIKGFRCAKDGCTRHYSFESGYFDLVPNEPVRFERIGIKPN